MTTKPLERKERMRLEKEIGDFRDGSQDNGTVSAALVKDNLREWRGQVKGPEGTPYEGGIFDIEIKINDDATYPYTPPKMRFSTKIWHPNVSSQTGAICLDILKSEWSPALTIRTALLSIQALLSTPEPKDPQDAQVAKMYIENRQEFTRTARFWTESFAMGGGDAEKVSQITAMGFTEAQAQEALAKANGDVTVALNSLLGD